MMKDDDALLADEMSGLLDALLKVSHSEANDMLNAAEGQIEEVRGGWRVAGQGWTVSV